VEALRQKGLRQIRFTPGLTREAFHELVAYLEPGEGDTHEGAGPPGEGAGIEINQAAALGASDGTSKMRKVPATRAGARSTSQKAAQKAAQRDETLH